MLGIAGGLMLANRMGDPAAIPTGTAVRVVGGDDEGVIGCANSVLQSTFRGSFTIAFWVKVVDGHPASAQVFFGNLNPTDYIALTLLDDGKIIYDFEGNDDGHQNKTDAAVFADGANAYKHIAITMTKVGGGNSTSIIYVNGAAVDTTIISGNEITEANHAAWDHENDNFQIGSMSTASLAGLGFTNFPAFSRTGLDADIAEFAIWNVVLDAAAIAKVEDLGVPTPTNDPNLLVDAGDYDVSGNLFCYWKFNDYSGGVANESKSGNHGALIGTSVFV